MPPPGIEISINAGDSSVARVQRALRKRGYYSGPVDGSAGRSTRSAIRSFRTDNGLSSTSRIDGALLRMLGL
jgi:peptidoglycan hydrolase-like protein with peptidoglycan-binding domain